MWEENNNVLYKEFRFDDFDEAFEFIKKVGVMAQEINHHPYWWNNYNVVGIRLCTHDAGGMITTLDREMAEKINSIAQ